MADLSDIRNIEGETWPHSFPFQHPWPNGGVESSLFFRSHIFSVHLVVCFSWSCSLFLDYESCYSHFFHSVWFYLSRKSIISSTTYQLSEFGKLNLHDILHRATRQKTGRLIWLNFETPNIEEGIEMYKWSLGNKESIRTVHELLL